MMASQYRPCGLHGLLDVEMVPQSILSNHSLLIELLTTACLEAGETPVSQHSHQFQPDGFSIVLVLAESHASMHTYPEHGVVLVNVFTCGVLSPEKALTYLQTHLGGQSRAMTLRRGFSGNL